ncbi:MAG: hypothetical protein Q9225_003276 [Loekoesia sp. 1 TL-2023]
MVRRICTTDSQQMDGLKRRRESDTKLVAEDEANKLACLNDVECVLSRFVSHILNHPGTLQSASFLRKRLRHELMTFLLAHIQQIEDNHYLSEHVARPDGDRPTTTSWRTYWDWVKGTSADHTSCPYSIDFEEFQVTLRTRTSSYADMEEYMLQEEVETSKMKKDLLWIAQYQRKCLEVSLEELADQCSEKTMDAIRCFVRVTDLYGQIYVARDIGIRVD